MWISGVLAFDFFDHQEETSVKSSYLRLDTMNIRRYRTSLFCLGASVCYLLAGQPSKAMAALNGEGPLKKNSNDRAQMLADRLNACNKKSLLDKIKENPKNRQSLTSSLDPRSMVLVGTDNCPGLDIPAGTVFNDTGTTIGANSTVSTIPLACNSAYTTTAGPDVIYRFTLPALASRIPTCSISLDPTGANWDPSIYILNSAAPGCPSGIANNGTNCVIGDDNGGSNVTEVITDANLDALPQGTYYLFIDSFYSSGALSAGTYSLVFNCTTVSSTAAGVGVSGRVLTSAQGRGLVGATVTLTDQAGVTKTVLTGKGGIYTFDDLEPGQTYVVNVSSKRFNFQPQVIQMNDNIAELNFIPQ